MWTIIKGTLDFISYMGGLVAGVGVLIGIGVVVKELFFDDWEEEHDDEDEEDDIFE